MTKWQGLILPVFKPFYEVCSRSSQNFQVILDYHLRYGLEMSLEYDGSFATFFPPLFMAFLYPYKRAAFII